MSESDASEKSEFNPDAVIQSQLVLHTQIEKALSNFKKTPKDRLTSNYIQTKLKLLDESWHTFEKNHKKILRNVDTKYLKDEIYMNTYFEVEDIYAIARDTMLTKLEEISPAQNSTCSTVIHQAQASVHNERSASDHTHAQHRLIKLPPIQIPSFDGQYSEWISFHDQFVSLIHNNTSLSNVNKLHLLKQNLVGEAANLLKNIAISETNYETAWLKLKKRYSNKRIIVNSYLHKLMSLRNVTQENAHSIRNLLDSATDCLTGLKSIGVDTTTWDPIVIHLITSKMDSESLKQWEENVSRECDDQLPTFEMLTNFLETRFRALEGVQSSRNNTRTTRTNPDNKRVFYTSPKEGCVVCGGDHFIYQCKSFVQMPVEDKKSFIEKNNLCFNCLIPNHGVKHCRQKSRCRICGRRHHSLIHTETTDTRTPELGERRDIKQTESKTSRERTSQTKNDTNDVASHYATEFIQTQNQTTNVLLATALVKVTAENGRTLQLRALIDQGSEGSFITESAAQTLGLRRNTINGSITGLGENIVMQARHSVSFDIQSNYDKTFSLPVNAYVLKSLTRLLPSKPVNMTWKHLQGLTLADPEYGQPAQIDLLLGAEIYGKIMLDGIVSASQGSPLAQRTSLGWILTGAVNSTPNLSNHHHVITMHITTHDEELDQLQKFWEIESEDTYKNKQRLTEEELKCEQIYADTFSRDTEGRYIVEIPLKDKDYDFGNTRQTAERRLEQLEKRLDKDKDLKEEYTKVLMEYSDLEHMEKIDDKEEDTKKKFYMPHHAVIRQDKTTSKLRIVFDASCKGPNGKSLNDNMMVGPKLQLDLRHIVMKWRRHQIAIIADCVKMYRQIKVTEESANYQRILWRVNGELKEYRMVRVTFGTASAPYLATKTLQQLAIDEEPKFPKASRIARSDFYMDDLLSGVDNLEEAYELYSEMTQLMGSGGFELQKWGSNSKDFEKHVHNERSKTDESYMIKSDEIVKTLGIGWNKSTDTFQYRINSPQNTKTVTKRLILSEISRLFDPMGWLAPVIITAKVLIQRLWLSRVSWDEEVPENIRREWIQFCIDLEQAKNISINRWYETNTNDTQLELHGYSDASQMAYAAVVYLRTVKDDGTIHVKLVTAKTRVAPIKTISVPRLELCGAVMLTKLLREVAEHLDIQQKDIHAYTDSSIVLAWLQCHPTKWKTL